MGWGMFLLLIYLYKCIQCFTEYNPFPEVFPVTFTQEQRKGNSSRARFKSIEILPISVGFGLGRLRPRRVEISEGARIEW